MVNNTSPNMQEPLQNSGSWLDTALSYLQDNKSEVGLLTGIAGMTGLLDNFTGAKNTGPRGYQGSIPNYTAARSRVPSTYDPTRRPGSGGQRYFTDTQFVPKVEGEAPATPMSAEGLAALNLANPARRTIPQTPTQEMVSASAAAPAPAPASGVATLNPVPTYTMASEFPAPVEETDIEARPMYIPPASVSQSASMPPPPTLIPMAAGGLAGLAKGRYLRSPSDGMADTIPATIDKTQPAALSGGEYVIPADVVSHLGNGNSDAGAKVLDKMMERIRKTRTGNGKQGKEIDPNKLLPA